MRTLGTRPLNPARPQDGYDMDNTVVDGLRSLEERIRQRLQFLIGTWDLDTRKGTESVLGFGMTPELAASVISAAIRDEGGDEVTDVVDVEARIDANRTMYYDVTVNTIYGQMALTDTAV